LGKFFEAMQRAAQEKSQPSAEPSRRSDAVQPELDSALLEPESEEGGAKFDASPATPDTDVALPESPSAVIRLLESDVHRARAWAGPPSRAERTASDQVQTLQEDSATRGLMAPLDAPVPAPLSDGAGQARPVLRDPDPTGVRVHPAYDRIVQRLLAYRRAPRQSVILVTSAVAGEGTSTVARNVATALSHSGTEQVLLLDANLRTPSQHRAFGVERANGLGEVLKGDVSLTSVLHSNVGSGISLITCGAPVKSPTQLLTLAGAQGVIMALLSLFDWIVIDSPPATPYPDVASLAGASGAAMLVIRAESTRSEVAEEARNVLQNSGVDLLGAVLNRRRYHIPSAIYKRL
jgi:capsular exopolysaccharide synthesis family protein